MFAIFLAAPHSLYEASQSVVGPGAAIKYPHGWSEKVDYEAGEIVLRLRLRMLSSSSLLIPVINIYDRCNRAGGDYW